MNALILAGGLGTRLSEETEKIPKPMVQIGGKPIIWHIMRSYEHHGITDFVVLCGYKSDHIKKFFIDYAATLSDLTIDLATNKVEYLSKTSEKWKITLLDTGPNTMTGGRLKRAITTLGLKETFCLTYGDGLSDVDIAKLILFHKKHGKIATVTAVTPPGRFGILNIDDKNFVTGFYEKILSDDYRINGGFFVLEPEIQNYIANDDTVFEEEPLRNVATDNQLMSWKHNGFWQPMDTLREKKLLEKLWEDGDAPWLKRDE